MPVFDDAVTDPEEILTVGTVRTSDGTPLEGKTSPRSFASRIHAETALEFR